MSKTEKELELDIKVGLAQHKQEQEENNLLAELLDTHLARIEYSLFSSSKSRISDFYLLNDTDSKNNDYKPTEKEQEIDAMIKARATKNLIALLKTTPNALF